MSLKIFTDGSASPNPGPGGWGFVVSDGDNIIFKEKGSHRSVFCSKEFRNQKTTTNNRMEYEALLHAYYYIEENNISEPVVIYTDSQLLVRSMNEWAKGWEKKGWRKSSGPVKNLDLVKKAFEYFKTYSNVSVAWVKGHANHPLNELADQLANEGRVS